jgi:hypothetical protein
MSGEVSEPLGDRSELQSLSDMLTIDPVARRRVARLLGEISAQST